VEDVRPRNGLLHFVECRVPEQFQLQAEFLRQGLLQIPLFSIKVERFKVRRRGQRRKYSDIACRARQWSRHWQRLVTNKRNPGIKDKKPCHRVGEAKSV
jgi:hypothetical protein